MSKTEDEYSLSAGFETIKNSKNNIIFFGSVGTGKTTLLNKTCGQNFEAKDEAYSVTREVQYAFTLRHNNIILDFPGLNSSVDVVAHLKAQKNALSIIPIRMICFIVRYTPRYDDIIKSVSQMLMIFREYHKNICIIVTNSEKSTIKSQSEIEQIFKTKFRIDKFLFTTLHSNGVDICDILDNYKNKMEFIDKINIKSSDLAQNIDPQFDFDVMEDREKFLNEFQDSLKIYKSEFLKAQDKDLKRALYFSLRDYKDNLIKRYNQIIQNKKADLDSIVTELIMFNNSIFNDFNEFKRKVEMNLETETKNFKGEFNKYKKCPNCGKIWFLVYGCPNTQCGKRSTIKDKIFGTYKNYLVSFFNGVLNISHREEGNNEIGGEKTAFGLTPEEQEKNKNRGTGGLALINPEGCGARLKWNEMEDVTEFVKSQLKEINENDIAVIEQIAGDPEKLIEEEKYEDALHSIFKDKTENKEKNEKKKKLVELILEKDPRLKRTVKQLSEIHEYNLI